MKQLDRFQVEEGIHKNKFTGIFSKCEPETLHEILMYGPVDIGNNNCATEMDIFNVKGLTDGEICMMVYGKIGVVIETDEGIRQLNHKFSQSVGYYTKYLFKHVPKRVNDNKDTYFKNHHDVIKFLRETEIAGRKAQLHCNLAQTTFCVSDILENPGVEELDQKSEYLIKTKVAPGLQINKQDKKGNYEGYFTINGNNGEYFTIQFKLKYRGKQNYSLIQKIGSDPNYSSSDLIKDGIGLEFEVGTSKDALYLMQYIVSIVYEGGHYGDEDEIIIKNKGVVSIEDIEEINGGLNENFKNMLLNISTEKKDQTSEGYKDIKFTGNVILPSDINREKSAKIKHGVEVKFVLTGNKNEEGLSHPMVYGYYKKIQNVSRMQGYVTENYIKIVVNKLLENYPEIEIKKEDIFNYYISECGLTEFTIGSNSTKFYTNGRGKVLRGTDFYPHEDIFKKK